MPGGALGEPFDEQPGREMRAPLEPARRAPDVVFTLIAEKQLLRPPATGLCPYKSRLPHCCHHSAIVSAPKRCTSGNPYLPMLPQHRPTRPW